MDVYTRGVDARKQYNARAYRQFLYRIHAGSDLDDRLSQFQQDGGSLNFLITDLLSGYFGVQTPYKFRYLNELNRLLDERGDEKLRMEDFPRMDFGHEPIIFSDEG